MADVQETIFTEEHGDFNELVRMMYQWYYLNKKSIKLVDGRYDVVLDAQYLKDTGKTKYNRVCTIKYTGRYQIQT